MSTVIPTRSPAPSYSELCTFLSHAVLSANIVNANINAVVSLANFINE